MSHVQDNNLVAPDVEQKTFCEEGTFADAEVVIKNAKIGDTLTEFEIDVSIVFDGAAPVSSIGIDSDHEKYLSEAQNDILSIGTYVVEDTTILVANETIKVYITPDGSTQGKLSASVSFYDTE